MAILHVLAGGVAAAIAWWAGIAFVFGPAQGILADPGLQSEKFLAAFTEAPLPRTAENPSALIVGLLVIGMIHSIVYSQLGRRFRGGVLRRGAIFGVIAWALMAPWFEFYLPWNVMREPFALVMLELACWLGVQLLVGVAIAGAFRLLTRGDDAELSGTAT